MAKLNLHLTIFFPFFSVSFAYLSERIACRCFVLFYSLSRINCFGSPVCLVDSLCLSRTPHKKSVGSCSQLKSLYCSKLPHMVVDIEHYLSSVK